MPTIGTININLDGKFGLPDGRIGSVASTPELSELNAFLGIIRDLTGKDFPDVVKQMLSGKVLEITSSKEGQSLKHTFKVV